jgi:DNA polymerase-3 subunit beta
MLTLKTKQLKDAITKSISGKGSMYEDVMLKATAGGDVLEVITADSDCFLSLFINGVNSTCDLEAVVNKKALANILKSVKDDVITLLLQESDDADYLVIKTEKANYRLKITANRIFEVYDPAVKSVKGRVLLNGDAIVKAIDKVIYAVSKKLDYQTYKSVGFVFEEKNKLIIAGTDGVRLAACYIDIEDTELTGRYGIPKASALYLKKFLKGTVAFDIVEFKYHTVAVFKGDGFIFTSFLADGGFPNIISVINGWRSNIKTEFVITKEAIVDVLKSIIIDKKETYPVKLTLSNNNLNILSINDNSTINIPINYTGDDYVIGFNAVLLLEAIENTCSDDVVIKLPDTIEHPAYIEPVGGCDCLALVMPYDIKA